jgi:hypothetical protein
MAGDISQTILDCVKTSFNDACADPAVAESVKRAIAEFPVIGPAFAGAFFPKIPGLLLRLTVGFARAGKT